VVVEGSEAMSALRIAGERPDQLDIEVDPEASLVRVTVADPLETRSLRSKLQRRPGQQDRVIVIVDGSIVEVFVNGAAPITTRWHRHSESLTVLPGATGERQAVKVSAVAASVEDS
jgi:hypothetical protein